MIGSNIWHGSWVSGMDEWHVAPCQIHMFRGKAPRDCPVCAKVLAEIRAREAPKAYPASARRTIAQKVSAARRATLEQAPPKKRGGLRKPKRCSECGDPGHNVRTCHKSVEAAE